MKHLRAALLRRREGGQPVSLPDSSPTRRGVASVVTRSIVSVAVTLLFLGTLTYVVLGSVAALVVALVSSSSSVR